MGLRNDINDSISSAFDDDLADAAIDITLKKVSINYNATTNKNTKTTIDHLTRGVVMGYDLNEITDESVQPNDVNILILQSEVNGIPVINDIIVADNVEYKIVRVIQDPVKVTWELQCRNL